MSTPSPLKSGVAGAVNATLSATPPADDPRARAAKRTAELRDHGSLDEGEDKYRIDLAIIPDGWSYEWKTFTVLGKENPSYQVSLAHKGWEAVPRTRHPELMPANHRGETIEREGMILMERPLEITQEAQQREKRAAREQVRSKEQQLNGAPTGQFERDVHPQTKAKITKSYESIPIPK